MTRVDSWFDDVDEHVSGVSIYCAVPALVQGASSYSVTLTPSTPAPYQKAAGSVATDERTDDCGTTGLSAITYTTGLADSYVEGHWQPLRHERRDARGRQHDHLQLRAPGDTSYNAWSNSTGNFFDEACNSNEVIVGFALRHRRLALQHQADLRGPPGHVQVAGRRASRTETVLKVCDALFMTEKQEHRYDQRREEAHRRLPLRRRPLRVRVDASTGSRCNCSSARRPPCSAAA